jgi:predicted AAA+ superfamily ATPase
MLTSSKLKQIILDQNSYRLVSSPTYIQRLPFDNILKFITDPQILIITGIRRAGKSTLMQQIRNTQQEKDFYLL